ncbi:hypothetical protein [Alteribacter natronophilus]|uniref:hypothetical protein n=1 Tax=Alteribacter natronophilus TaxID=2583810 RepID=UPI00110D5E05|nr:hypothetical protein [Alteribacter natronophilus]TMW70432.1 hypothetical protein FGB90_17350 [Alteribacter natronophilus]
MHTILLNENTLHPEWKLFDPFFYSEQAEGRLTTISYGQRDGFAALLDVVYKEVTEKRADDWHLVVLLHLDYPVSLKERLTAKLTDLKQTLVAGLKRKEAAPRKVTVLVMDALYEYDKGETCDTGSSLAVEMDFQGYLSSENLFERKTNLWTRHDFDLLDEAWGPPVDTENIGRIDHPDPQIYLELESRAESVRRCFSELQLEKQNQKGAGAYADEWMTRTSQRVEELFKVRLNQEITPPLSRDLAGFRPSSSLKTILKKNLSLDGALSNLTLIRQTMPRYAKDKKYGKWLEAAAFLQVIIQRPDLITKSIDGQQFYLNARLNDQEVDTLFSNYRLTLETARETLQTRLDSRAEMLIKRFEKVDANPQSSEPLEEDLAKPGPFVPSQVKSMADDWTQFLNETGVKLKEREEVMQQSARKGIETVKVHQRAPLNTESGKVLIGQYLEEIERDKNDLLLELESSTNPPGGALETWKTFREKHTRPLHADLKAYPDMKKRIVTALVLWIGLAFPLFYSLGTPGTWPQWQEWGHYLLIVILLAAVTGISFTGVRQLTLPITQTLEETGETKNDLFSEQQNRHEQTNRYLNGIFRIERLHREEKKVKEELDRKQLSNQLDHYHHREVKDALDALSHLEDHLHVQQRKTIAATAIQQFVNEKFDASKDVGECVIYSPLKCGEAGRNDYEPVTFVVGQTRTQVEPGKWKLLDEAKIQKDKVLHV